MPDEGTSISQPELKQAANTHGLTVWLRQWDISDKGRFLYQLKLKVTTQTLFDFPNRKLYSQIAQIRIGYAKLNDYMQKMGILETRTCKCRENETIEYYLFHLNQYFNEREAMRTTLFQQTGITELTTDLLLGCDDSDLE